jgi:hypothetical protein
MRGFALFALFGAVACSRLAEAPTEMCSGDTSHGGLLDGRWLCAMPGRKDAADQHCIYAPFQCRYGVHDRSTLVPAVDALQQQRGFPDEPMWFAFVGDSRMRGLWLLWIDLLIENGNLTTSSAWKCWGQEDFSSRNLRLTWHDMRELDKDPLRRAGVKQQLALVKADFDKVLRSPSGRRPDTLIMQFGFDVLPVDLAHNSSQTRRIQLSGWDYWKDGAHLSTHTFEPQANWELFDTKRLTLPMLDQMCDEKSEDRKHFHSACGRQMCGFVNQMQAQILFSILFGAPREPTHRVPPLTAYRICTACKKEFDTKYCLDLPPPTCEVDALASRLPPDDREFCVDKRMMLDAHLIKVHGHAKNAHRPEQEASLFHLPGSRIVTMHNNPQFAPQSLPEVVDAEVVLALEDCKAREALLLAEVAKHKQESMRWLAMFNDLSHKINAALDQTHAPATSAPETHHTHKEKTPPQPFLTLRQRISIVVVVVCVFAVAAAIAARRQ